MGKFNEDMGLENWMRDVRRRSLLYVNRQTYSNIQNKYQSIKSNFVY